MASSILNLPQTQRGSVPLANVPTVQVAQTDGGGRALLSVAGLLQESSVRIEKRLDLHAAAEGRKQGTLAGMEEELPDLMDETTIRGAAFNESAKDAAITKLAVQGRLKLSELEEKHATDPLGFKKAADAYHRGATGPLNEFDPALAQRYSADFALRQDTAMTRVTERHQAVVRDSMVEDALRLQIAAGEEMGQQASTLFTGGPENVQKNLAALTANAVKIVDVANQFGPDGKPLFTATQRIALEEDAKKSVATHVAVAWMGTQPDMISAWQTWQKGEASINVAGADGQAVTMPLKEVLGEPFYLKAQEAFMGQLKSQLALEAQITAAQDRNFKKGSDQTFSDLSVLGQDGGLQLETVEAAKGQLEQDKYLTLRTLAKSGGASVSDGAALTRLTAADIDGQNIADDLRQAYETGKVTRQDYLQLYERNASRMTQGQKDPISQGRDLVTGSLGKLSTELGLAQSLLISEAESDYALRVDDLIRAKRKQRKEGDPEVTTRDLTLRETLDIAKQVKDRYSVMAAEKSAVSLELPQFMTASQKYSNKLGTKELSDIASKTRAHYLEKNKGDEAALREDREYQNQSALIQKYFDVLKYKEGAGNAGSPAAQ